MTQADSRPLWTPSEERIRSSRMHAYMLWLEEKYGMDIGTYGDLYSWSIDSTEKFWESVWQFADIVHSAPYRSVLEEPRMPGAKWFTGARLNFAENLLRYNDSHTALISYRENQQPIRLSYAELYDRVSACAKGLKKLGVIEGDRVAAYIPNLPEAVIGMLAATSLGAVWSSCSPDFGMQGALDRFSQITPKVLITADGYSYGGKVHSSEETVRHVAEKIPAIEKVVVVRNIGSAFGESDSRVMTWDELLTEGPATIAFQQLPFDHPIYIMYSSGTTGKPKCIVHGAGGTLLQHYKELALHTDLHRADKIFYFTTCGWMMWNWLVSSLMLGATVVLYDGSPAYPNAETLWSMAEREQVTIFGTSPRFLSASQQVGLKPKNSRDLSALRIMLSTGSPLAAENFEYVYREVKEDLQLSSISGGTDIISCFMLGNPMLPVYAQEIQCRGLGMKVEAYDVSGRPAVGRTGELVCSKPFPSMPVSFWNDSDGSAYRAAYFTTYPNVWRHGDYITITERGGVIVFGRSDATLNPGGVRIGTAEIYNPVEALAEVKDSLVVGQRWKQDVRIVLFVVLTDGMTLTDELKRKITDAIRRHNTPRHVSSVILQINEVPRTLNGKKVEVAVAQVIHGEAVGNRDSLINPDSLGQFEHIAELQS